jgi:hypothetical protein
MASFFTILLKTQIPDDFTLIRPVSGGAMLPPDSMT